MILGVDHLALTATDTDQAKKMLEAKGLKCVFIERNAPNDPSKKILLEHYQPTHDLAVFQSTSGGVSIEITNHGTQLADNIAPYHYKDDYIELHTTDIQAETIFWQKALYFNKVEKKILKFTSPVPNWSCTLKLKEVSILKTCTLDGKGYPCLALLTNNLIQDTKNIVDSGAKDVAKPFKSFINNKPLDIIMFRTPTGAICELIQIGK